MELYFLRLTNCELCDIIIKVILEKLFFAGVMELADVPDSKSGGSDTVRVRPPPPAPQVRLLSFVFAKESFLRKFYIKRRGFFEKDTSQAEAVFGNENLH